jgi:hypothetical protein
MSHSRQSTRVLPFVFGICEIAEGGVPETDHIARVQLCRLSHFLVVEKRAVGASHVRQDAARGGKRQLGVLMRHSLFVEGDERPRGSTDERFTGLDPKELARMFAA